MKIMKKQFVHKLFAILLTLTLLLSSLGMAMPAAAKGGCSHVHGAECAYVDGVEGVPCNHAHDESCGGLPPGDSGSTVTFTIVENASGLTALYLPEGNTVTDADLLAGVTAEEENGNSVAVTVKNTGGLNLTNPARPDDPIYPVTPYTITYEAAHPATGELFITTREVYVTAVEIMPMMESSAIAIPSTLSAPVITDYEITNGIVQVSSGTWANVATAGGTLSLTDGDTLTITAVNSPSSPVLINITAPDDSVVTIKGIAGGTYSNVHILVLNDNITLKLENLNIIAPTQTTDTNGLNAILFSKSGSASGAVDVAGNCSITGGMTNSSNKSAGRAISCNSGLDTDISISGDGTLTVTGGENVNGHGGEAICAHDLTAKTKIIAKGGASRANLQSGANGIFVTGELEVDTTLSSTGGSSNTNMGGYGIMVMTGLVTEANARITATGGDGLSGGYGFSGPNSGNLEINTPMVVTGGKGTSYDGGYGLYIRPGKLVVKADLTAIGGDGVRQGGSGVYAQDILINSGTINSTGGEGSGTSGTGGYGLSIYDGDISVDGGMVTVTGGSGTKNGGHGIFTNGAAKPSSVNVDSGTVVSTGGTGTGANSNGGIGIYCHKDLNVTSGDVAANGGTGTFQGGTGIYVSQSVNISDGKVTAQGVQSVPTGVVDFWGGDGLSVVKKISITGGTVIAKAGVCAGEGAIIGQNGLYSYSDIYISNAIVTATSIGSRPAIKAASEKVVIENNATVTATGGNAVGNDANNSWNISGGYGIYGEKGVDMTDSTVNAYGGDGVDNNANGGRAIAAEDTTVGYINISGGDVTALGGDGAQHGGHGIFSYGGDITIKSGANVASVGGNGTRGMGGMGMRAFGQEYDTQADWWYVYGKTVTITKDAGEIYIRGGQGSQANGRRASIAAGEVYIASGNVETIVKESDAPNFVIKNTSGGGDVHMLTVNTSPAAITTITCNVVTAATGLSPMYTYKAPTKADGIAYMWLPTVDQTVSASGYEDGSVTVTADNLTTVTLYEAAQTYTLTIMAENGGSITAGASGQYEAGTQINIAATADSDYMFSGWTTTNGGILGDADNPSTTFTMPANATAITANFTANTPSDPGNIFVTGITLNKTSTTLTVNEMEALIATVAPANATNKAVAWTSNNTDVATVDGDGKVTAISVGTGIITVTTADGSYTATCDVTVEEIAPPEEVSYHFTEHFGTYTGQKEGLTGVINAEIAKFMRLEVSSVTLDASNYEVAEGSTIIMLYAAYLNTLDNGTYAVRAVFTDGYADGSFTINGSNASTCTINATAGKHGSIAPAGKVAVLEGESQTFTFTPNSGYAVDKVTVDGKAVSITSNLYTFADVQANHTIHATFKSTADHTIRTTFKSTADFPRTSDNSDIWLWAIRGLSGILAGLWLLVWRKWQVRKNLR